MGRECGSGDPDNFLPRYQLEFARTRVPQSRRRSERMRTIGSCQLSLRRASSIASPSAPQPLEQLRCWPGIRRQPEFHLHVAHRTAALQAKHAVDPTDIVAASLQQLLQLARLLEADLRNVRTA